MEKLFISESFRRKDWGGRKIGRVMKLTTCLILLCSCFAFANHANSQEAKVSLNMQEVQLEEVLDAIEAQTEYLFISNRHIDLSQRVSVSVENKSVRDVLGTVLKGTGLSFEVEGVNIVLTKAGKNSKTFPQQDKKKVTGTIVDQSGLPIAGANIVEKGTMNGVISDMDGNYSIEVGNNAELQVSYIGYIDHTISVAGKETVNVVLREDMQSLDEVVVVGYGTQKKANLTGAVSQVTSKVLENRPITNLGQGLQGVIPNLNVSFDGGNPNSEATMNIRGLASISGEGSSPLVLVDGVQMNLNMVNPEDVESVSVLKDASSAAIYGARGAFGVILITTKQGQTERKPVIEYSGSVQFNTHTYLPDMLSAPDYMDAMNESSFNSTGKPKYSDQQVQWVKDYYNDPVNNPVYHIMENGKIFWNSNNDNYAQMLQKWAPTHKHTVNISGGGKSVRFYASAGYMNQEGMFKDATDIFKST